MTATTLRETSYTWNALASSGGVATLELTIVASWKYQAAPLVILLSSVTTANIFHLDVNRGTTASPVWVSEFPYTFGYYMLTVGTLDSGGTASTTGQIFPYASLTGSTSYHLDRFAASAGHPALRLRWASGGTAPTAAVVTVISPGTV